MFLVFETFLTQKAIRIFEKSGYRWVRGEIKWMMQFVQFVQHYAALFVQRYCEEVPAWR